MGSCVSSQKNVTQESTVKKKKLSDIPFTKDGNPTLALKSQWSSSRSISSFRDYGSKDDCFFDSKPWLESDCEDDFFSVNGELTPSRGSTPLHQSFSMGHSKVDKSPSDGNASSPVPGSSPGERKKKLVELFRDSVRDNKNDLDDHLPNEKETMLNLPLKSTNGTLSDSGTNSVCTSGRAANGDFLNEGEKPITSAQCCLPGFSSCRTASERKRMDLAEVVENAPAAV